ncbi:hypothetical protein LCGC14_0295290 [marine sediment metagenome]|uniref:Uncharacterized protein n=1 Tax=marine sediment metagenome TaxID=412755 RepID=A0A0F9WDG4_9ZZZZ
MADELKSWYQEQYNHPCPTCKLEHSRIPTIRTTYTREEGSVEMRFLPCELRGVVEGTIHPGREEGLDDTPANIYGLLWGIPGTNQALFQDILYMN